MLNFDIKAICCDVVGTCVDWRGSILRSLDPFGLSEDQKKDFTHRWMLCYAHGWIKSEAELARMGYDLLGKFGLRDSMTREEITLFESIWTRLDPWPDTVPGLTRLGGHYRMVALTNLSQPGAVELSKSAGLPWNDCFSADAVGVKKPDPRVYQMALDRLAVPAGNVLMVAAHLFDLDAAKEQGFITAYVNRGEDRQPTSEDNLDLVVTDFNELADALTPGDR